jgi:hypothetical protein
MRFIITGLLLIASLWVLWTHQPPWAFALYVCSWVLVGIINAEREYRIAQRLYERGVRRDRSRVPYCSRRASSAS